MKIKNCKIRVTNIPFVIVFKHSLKSRSEVEGILVEIENDSGHIGYGEALPRDYVTGETTQSVTSKLLSEVFPKLTGMTFNSREELFEFLNSFHTIFSGTTERDLCVKTATELALLDLFGKENNQSVIDLFGGKKVENITYSGIVSADTPIIVKQILKQYKKYNIKQIKLKVGKDLDRDLKNIELAKEIIGEGVQLRVDANEGWGLDEAKRNLDEMIKAGVVSVEQPMPANNPGQYPKLVQHLAGKMDVSLDESLCSVSDAKMMIEARGATIFNLRVSKNGGISTAYTLYKMALEAGLKCQLGSQVGETSLLSSAGRILALITGDLVFHEGSFGTRLLSHDLTKEPLMFEKNGIGSSEYLNRSVGLGVNVNQKLLEKMTKTILA